MNNPLAVVPLDDELRGEWLSATLKASIARQIRVLRESRGMTQAELAKRLGTTQSVVARMENPRYGNMTTSTLCEIAHIFDVGLIVQFCTYSEYVLMITATGVYIKSYQDDMAERDAALKLNTVND